MKEIVLLLVEDNEDDRFLTLRTLQRLPRVKQVLAAVDGVEALEMLSGNGHGQQPDLILLDLQLPRISGQEVLSQLRNSPQTRHVPVAILTASDNPLDLDQCLTLGANAYLTKPLEVTQLEEVIQRLGLS
jgi:CheY-like chemotaxis protein